MSRPRIRPAELAVYCRDWGEHVIRDGAQVLRLERHRRRYRLMRNGRVLATAANAAVLERMKGPGDVVEPIEA